MRTAAQRPHRQVKPEWRRRPETERELWHWNGGRTCYSMSLSGIVFGAGVVDLVLCVLEAVVVDFLLVVLDAVAEGFFLCSYL